MAAGKIYVFDLDETLVSSINGVIITNPNIIERIYAAVQLRNSKRGVDALLLLTNNLNMVSKTYGKTTVEFKDGFVTQALIKIVEAYNVLSLMKGTTPVSNADEIFDSVYTAEKKFFNSGRRTRGKVAVKNINTVVNMLKDIVGKNISVADLENRIFYFDDDSTHELKKQISKSGYIKINPPFGHGPNLTRYKNVNNFYKDVSGGRRKTAKSYLKRN